MVEFGSGGVQVEGLQYIERLMVRGWFLKWNCFFIVWVRRLFEYSEYLSLSGRQLVGKKVSDGFIPEVRLQFLKNPTLGVSEVSTSSLRVVSIQTIDIFIRGCYL